MTNEGNMRRITLAFWLLGQRPSVTSIAQSFIFLFSIRCPKYTALSVVYSFALAFSRSPYSVAPLTTAASLRDSNVKMQSLRREAE